MNNLVHAGQMPFRQDPSRRVQRLIHSTTVSARGGFVMGIVEYCADESKESDLHEDQEGLFVLDGNGLAQLGQEEYELSPGDCIYIPAGVPHTIVKRGPSPIRLVFARSGSRSG